MDREPERDGGFAGSASILANAQGVNISGGDFRAVQGRYVNVFHGGTHHHPEGGIKPSTEKAIWKALEAVPNFRKIYQDMLSKATEGTGMWLLKNDKFRIWLEANGDIKIFWGSGNPGAGKTVLATLVIHRLEALHRKTPDQICVCYFYFRYSDSTGLTLRSVLETLLKQTLERHPAAFTFVEKEYSRHMREGTQPSEAELLGVLRKFTDNMAAAFYVLDALDEAPSLIRNAIIRSLSSLNVKLFITSRPLETVQAVFPQAYRFSIEAHEDDIELHISKGINDSPGLLNLVMQEGRWLREEIMTSVKRKSSGMFLHASLQMDALRPCISLHQTKRILEEFPLQIKDAYLQTWRRILDDDEEHVQLVKVVFLWILNAERSMTLQELERAVATSPYTFKFEADRVVPGTTLISMCRGLLVVEEESQIVRLVHYTARQHLDCLLHSSFLHPHSLLATVCVTHLKECGMQNSTIASMQEFIAVLKDDPLLTYASDAWAFHVCRSLDSDTVKTLAANFVEGINAFPVTTTPRFESSFDLLSPIHTVAHYHLPLELLADPGDTNLATRILRQTPLIVACQKRNKIMVDILLETPDIKVNEQNTLGCSALMHSAENGYDEVVRSLLTHSDIEVNLCFNSHRVSALILAAHFGYDTVISLLLAHPEIQVNHVNTEGHTAFTLASQKGHERVAILLLARPTIQVHQVDKREWTALLFAAQSGLDTLAALLLARPDSETQLNQASIEGYTPLMIAAKHGQERIAALLLAHPKIHVNQADKRGWVAFMFAAQGGHEGVAQLLLAHPQGVRVNHVDKRGWSALMIAAQHGHERIARLLIMAHPETRVNQASIEGYTALILAGEKGHEPFVSLLLGHRDIRVNRVDGRGVTALMTAAHNGHEPIVRILLLVPGIDCGIKNKDGYTAAAISWLRGHFGIHELLQARLSSSTENPQNVIPLDSSSRSVGPSQSRSLSASPPPDPTGTPVNESLTVIQTDVQPDTPDAPENEGDLAGSVKELVLSFLLHIV